MAWLDTPPCCSMSNLYQHNRENGREGEQEREKEREREREEGRERDDKGQRSLAEHDPI